MSGTSRQNNPNQLNFFAMISIFDPISHGSRRTHTKTHGKRVCTQTKRTTKLEQLCVDFAAEIDLFDSMETFPGWILNYRDDLLRKISPELRRICYALKQIGQPFKIKWPVKIDGKWKFADILLPQQRTVVIVVNPMELASKPHWMLSERSEFFKRRYHVIEVENLEELQHKMGYKQLHLQ